MAVKHKVEVFDQTLQVEFYADNPCLKLDLKVLTREVRDLALTG